MERGERVYVIAEAGSNFRMGTPERDLAMAKTLIEVAAEAGADAVKFQTFKAETVYAPQAGLPSYLEQLALQKDIHELFRDLTLPYEWLAELKAYCDRLQLDFLSSSFSERDLEAVDPFVHRHKIASYEISHRSLLKKAATTRKPILLSTGGSDEEDIAWAVEFLKEQGSGPVTLLQCTLSYPTPPEGVNLRVIPWLRERFKLPVGFSDHSRDPLCAPLGAVALGATVVEKHFTLDNRLPGPDHRFAVTADELAHMVRAIRTLETMRGDGVKRVEPAEQEMSRFGRRRVQALRDIHPGEPLHEGDAFAILRPGSQPPGVHPRLVPQIEGALAACAIARGTGLREGDWVHP